MGALLDQFAAEGVQVEAAGDGKLQATGRLTNELRALIRANKPAILSELAAANDTVSDQYAGEADPADPDVMRRRSRALAILDATPDRQTAIVAEAGDPAHVAVAIRGIAVGELTIPAMQYEAWALLALMRTHGHA